MLTSQDELAIKETIKLYFNGSYYANAADLHKAFHKDALIAGIFDGHYVEWSLTQFIERIIEAQSHKHEPFLKEILSIEGEKTLAVVKTKVAAGTNIFTDYISLIKINGNWVIRYKSFTN